MTTFGDSKIARVNDNKEHDNDAPVMFETFEPRILMNGSLLGLELGPLQVSDFHPVIVQDADRGHTTDGPKLAGSLANDTGSSATDHLTTDPTVAGQVTDRDHDFVKLTGGLDQASTKNFVDLTSAVKSDGTFLFGQNVLQQLAGGTLADGMHTLHLAASDAAGHSGGLDLPFALDTDKPALTAKLANDTGASATDGITNDDTIIGKAADPGDGIARLTGGFDRASASNFVDLTSSLKSGGTFALDPGLLNRIARGGGENGGFRGDDHRETDGGLADGNHTLHLSAVDHAGNATSLDVNFTLKTTAPKAPGFDLAPADVNHMLEEHVTDAGRITLVGTTDANMSVTLAVPGSSAVLSTVSDAKGKFEFVDVNVAVGRNRLTATATDVAGNTSNFSLNIQRVAPVPKGDAALQWNQITLNAIQLAALDPVTASRVLALESLAVLDTINAIDGTPAFLVKQTAKAGTSAEAAVATAAHEVLAALFPGQKTSLDAQYQAALAKIGTGSSDQGGNDGQHNGDGGQHHFGGDDGQHRSDKGDGHDHGDNNNGQNTSKADGIALGTSIADQVIALRANDGSQVVGQFDGGTKAGQWHSTGPNFGLAIRPEFASVNPFAMSSADQFLSSVQPPPDLASTTYAAAVNEVQSLGSLNSKTRTADQTQIAKFWSDGLGTLTEAGQWNQIAAQVAQKQGNSLADNARLFGELNVGLADAGIAAWNAKYNFDLWSPVTAIRNAASTGNPGVTSDSNFTSLVTTPEVPEFVATQSALSTAAAAILGNFFGQGVTFSATSAAGATRNFTSFSQAALEAGRSGIYAGTDFQFSNVAGQNLGQKVGDLVLKTFDISKDTLPPKVLLDQPTKGLVTNKDPVITGHVLDNLAGVASLQVKLDNGSLVPVSFDQTGKFSVPVNLALDGSADGQHALTFIATDAVGNATAPLTVSFTLATKGPQLSFTNGLADGAVLQAGTGLMGTAATTAGISLTGLSYSFDHGASTSVVFDATAHNSFNQAFDLSQLNVGVHTLTVAASDAAGNVTVQDFKVSLVNLIPLKVTSVNPAEGAGTVGVTFRPLVQFSRAIDVSTLTNDSFFLTDSAGNKIATTIVPWNDHMHAWLFPGDAVGLPGGQAITLHIDGSKIKGAADGAALDAVGLGKAGSVFTESFSTVNNAKVAGTSISGQIVDPGPKLDIGTTDTPNPIAGVTVYILGHENEAVLTDAQGRFSFSSAPVGDVKVVIDGRTATSAPNGISFPVLVVDLNVKPGQNNTIEGSRGSVEAQLANTNTQQLFLPRLNTDVMQTLNQNAPTVLRTTADSSPTLTPEQLQQMTLTIQPGSLIGEDGKPLPATAQVGFSVVPRDTIKDMLPVGLAQHSFDLTIQAPQLSSFTTPAALTLPNVFKLPPGSKTNLLTFDYTTGRLEIDGTCTVSADGKTVTTDAGSGVTKIGWHSMTPAGSMTGNNPTPPPHCDIGKVFSDSADALLKDAAKALTTLKKQFGGFLKTVGEVILVARDGYHIFNDGKNFIDKFNAGTLTQDDANKTAATISGSISNFISVGIESATKLNTAVASLKTVLTLAQAGVDALSTLVDNADKEGCLPHNLFTSFIEFQLHVANFVLKLVNDGITDMEKGAAAGVGKLVNDLLTPMLSKLASMSTTPATHGPTNALALAKGAATASAPNVDDLLALGVAELPGLVQATDAADAAVTRLANQQLPDPDQFVTITDQLYEISTGSAPNAPYAFFLPDGNVIRGRSDANGAIQAFLPPNTIYQFGILDTRYNRAAFASGTTGPSGTPTTLPQLHYQGFNDLGPDSNGDGVPDTVKAIVGLNPNGPKDQIIPGMRDLEALDEGLDATSKSLTTTTGIVANVPLQGEAQAVALVGSTNHSNQQTAYVATGSYGLAIVDATNAKNPIVLGQLKLLGGTATDVAVDANLHIAAVATGTGGLQLVNIEQGNQPTLLRVIKINANHVKVVDGIAYADDGGFLDAIDLISGRVLQRINPEAQAFGVPAQITSLAREGSTLYTLDTDNRLSIVDTSSGRMVVQGGTAVPTRVSRPAATQKFLVADGIAYVPDGSAGYLTFDVSNPAAPQLLGNDSFANGIVGGAIALNGSGLGVTVGQLTFTPGAPSFIDLLNTRDPTQTNQFITSYALPVNPFDVAIGEGIAFVADGTAGLQVVNYESTDTKGVAPTIQVLSAPTSINPAAPGVQLVEGQNVSFKVKVTDDVQVRNVELVATSTDPITGAVNTFVLKNSVSFPFELSGELPRLKSLGGATHVTLQVRATDTGGNVALSSPMDVTLVADATAPTITDQSVRDGAIRTTDPGIVTFDFSKALDPNTVSNSTFFLVAPDGSKVPVSVALHNQGRSVELAYNQALALGQYQLEVDATHITDLAGNALGTSILTTHFTVEQITDQWVGPLNGGNWTDAANWSAGRVPDATDNVLVDIPASGSISLTGQQVVGSLAQTGPGALSVDGGSLTVAGQASVQGEIDVRNGTLVANGATTINSLQLLNGTLAGRGTVTLTGSANVANGQMIGTGTTISQGVLTINDLGLDDGRVLENQGAANWIGGSINLNPNSTGNAAAGIFRNDAGAIFNAQGGGFITTNVFDNVDNGASGMFDNRGTLIASTGFTAAATLINSGSIQVAANNTIRLGSGGTQSGSFSGSGGFIFTDFGGGASFNFTSTSNINAGFVNFRIANVTLGGTIMAAAGNQVSFGDGGNISITGTVTGAGTVTVNGASVSVDANASYMLTGTTSLNAGTLTFAGPATIDGTTSISGGTLTLAGPATTVANLKQSGGVLTGTGIVTVTRTTQLLGGEMNGTGTTIAQGGLTIDGAGTIIAGGRTLENQGVANWNGGFIQFGDPSIVAGAAANADGIFRNDLGAVFNANVNNGFAQILSVDGPAAALFDNRGTFHQIGAVAAQIGVSLANSGTLQTDNSGLALNGGGISTGSIVVGASTSLNINSDFTIAGGTVTGAGLFDVGAGTVVIKAPTQYALTGSTKIDGGTLQLDANATTATFVQFGGLLTGSGTLTVTGTTDLEGGTMGGSGKTIAAGGLTIRGNGIAIGDGRVLENQGDAEWLAGQINLNSLGDGNPAGGIFRNDASATFNQRFDGAQILANAGVSALFDNLGAYYKGVNGPPSGPPPATVISVDFNNAGELRINDNTVQFTRTFTDAGTITIATGATLAISGDLAMQPSSVLDIGIGKGVGLLNVIGLMTFNGTLNAVPDPGFAPTVGQSFIFAKFGSKAGAFATVGGTSLGGGKALSLNTSDANDFRFDVVATAAAAIVAPQRAMATT
jgi:hypothetical protein